MSRRMESYPIRLQYRGFEKYESRFGTEQALKVQGFPQNTVTTMLSTPLDSSQRTRNVRKRRQVYSQIQCRLRSVGRKDSG